MKKSTIIVVVVAVLMAVPLTLYASHQFQDVPNSHTFHTAIDFMATNGITQGCNPPANTNYCPDDPVTRGQMAGFLKRFHDTFIGGGGSATGLGFAARSLGDPVSSGNGVVQGLGMTVQVPEAGVLVVEGSFQLANFAVLTSPVCGVNLGSPPDTAVEDSFRIIDLTVSPLGQCETAVAVNVSPGARQVRLVVLGAAQSTEALGGSVSAVPLLRWRLRAIGSRRECGRGPGRNHSFERRRLGTGAASDSDPICQPRSAYDVILPSWLDSSPAAGFVEPPTIGLTNPAAHKAAFTERRWRNRASFSVAMFLSPITLSRSSVERFEFALGGSAALRRRSSLACRSWDTCNLNASSSASFAPSSDKRSSRLALHTYATFSRRSCSLASVSPRRP